MREIINHPVHVFNKSGYLSPSAFIPMCSFGGVLEKSEANFDVGFPVCNSFRPVLHFDQVCYEVDLNDKYKKDEDLLRNLEKGIILTLDYNEERQIGINEDKNATMYFNTISTNKFNFQKKMVHVLDPLELQAVGQYEQHGDIFIHVYREYTVTNSFLTLDKNTRRDKQSSI